MDSFFNIANDSTGGEMATEMHSSYKTYVALTAAALIAFGCGEVKTADDAAAASDTSESSAATNTPRFAPIELKMPTETLNASPESNATRNAYFGDLHVHTNYSFDAFAFGTVASPFDAYRFAQGEAIKHPAGFDIQLRAPLDFYAVTDHAMFLGAVKETAGYGDRLFPVRPRATLTT